MRKYDLETIKGLTNLTVDLKNRGFNLCVLRLNGHTLGVGTIEEAVRYMINVRLSDYSDFFDNCSISNDGSVIVESLYHRFEIYRICDYYGLSKFTGIPNTIQMDSFTVDDVTPSSIIQEFNHEFLDGNGFGYKISAKKISPISWEITITS